MTGADILIACLQAQGVDTLTGIKLNIRKAAQIAIDNDATMHLLNHASCHLPHDPHRVLPLYLRTWMHESISKLTVGGKQ